MKDLQNTAQRTPFRPTLEGCVARDLRMASAMGECYQAELFCVAAYLWRSLICEPIDGTLSESFEACAKERVEQFRLIGELIAALGGTPTLRTRICLDQKRHGSVTDRGRRILCDAISDERYTVDRFQTLMGCTSDRIVRSVMAQLLQGTHRRLEMLQALLAKSSS